MILQGDCTEKMRELDEASIDAIVCDPPYGLEFMGKEWDRLGAGTLVDPAEVGGFQDGAGGNAYSRSRVRFGATAKAMQAWHELWATEALRILKPGGHLLAFGGTRTYHRLACAVEDAGFEIRDSLVWLYGAGFPKSLNLDRLRGEQFCGCGDDPGAPGQPSAEYDLRSVREGDLSTSDAEDQRGEVLLAGVSESSASGNGGVSEQGLADGAEPGVEGRGDDQAPEGQLPRGASRSSASVGAADGTSGRLHSRAPAGDGADDRAPADAGGSGASHGSQPGEQHADEPGALADERLAQNGRAWPDCPRCGLPVVPRGLGTALKPAHEPIVVARKPLAGTVAANVTEHGTGALNIDGCRVGSESTERTRTPDDFGLVNDDGWEPTPGVNGSPAGRWPANVALSPEAAAELDRQSGELQAGVAGKRGEVGMFNLGGYEEEWGGYGDAGGASRFFYVAKASKAERNAGLDGFALMDPPGSKRSAPAEGRESALGRPRANGHPTVKPIDLMRWLVRLVTPPGGTVLDPFLGSGTTGCAAALEGFDFIGIEREAEYAGIAEARIIWWSKIPVGTDTDDALGLDSRERVVRESGQGSLLEEAA